MPSRRGSYKLSPRAKTDLEEIWLHSANRRSVQQLDAYHNDIVATIEKLAQGLLSGRPLGIRSGYLKRPAGSHLIIYRDSQDPLVVLRILQQRMDVVRHL